MGRPLLAIAVVLVVGVPIGWLLFHQPGSGGSDAAIHYVTRDDDRYIRSSTEPVEDPESPPPSGSPTPTPSRPTGTPTPTPSSSPTPGETPSASPTGSTTAGPTSRPTGGPSNSRLSAGPTTDGPPDGPAPTNPSTDGPGPEETDPPPPDEPKPPVDTGSMDGAERELFSMIDNARAERGCAPLKPNSGLTGSARDEAKERAEDDELNGGGSRKAAAGGANWSAADAYRAMMRENSGTLMNCGLRELGVGRKSVEERECVSRPLLICLKYRTVDRVSWVTKFN